MSLEDKTNELLGLIQGDDPIGKILGEKEVEDTQPDMEIPEILQKEKLFSYKYGKGGIVALWEVTDSTGVWHRIAKSEPDGPVTSCDFRSNQLHRIATALGKLVKEE